MLSVYLGQRVREPELGGEKNAVLSMYKCLDIEPQRRAYRHDILIAQFLEDRRLPGIVQSSVRYGLQSGQEKEKKRKEKSLQACIQEQDPHLSLLPPVLADHGE